MLVSGQFLFALGIVLNVQTGLGLGPWDALHQGMSRRLPVSIGQAAIVVGLLVLVVTLLLKQRPGLGTLTNLILIGSFIDIILSSRLVPDLSRADLVSRLAVHVAGVLIIGVGSALYIKAGLGAGPRDGLMIALSRLSGIRVGVVRTSIELSVLVLGYALGGTVGIGTLIFALGIGIAVDVAFRLFKVKPHQ